MDKIIEELMTALTKLNEDDLIESINELKKKALHEVSPMINEPVDCVIWVKNGDVHANDYNPNKVAPPEMELLEVSILNDGYTQPIVTWPIKDGAEVIDGFHRSRVGKESKVVKDRVKGYLPIVSIRKEQSHKNDRIASTIRHNRARGKHQIDAMSEIVIELKNRNWTNSRIARELGMDEDEILRLCQITGLEHLFSDADFSKSWESDDSIDEFEVLTDDVDLTDIYCRTVNTSDEERIFHTYEKWECQKAGFYASKKEGMTKQECEDAYAEFLRDSERFSAAADCVINEWKHSCEHYLTNKAMNRIAWIGQAAMCYATGVPSVFCYGFNQLTDEEKEKANKIALDAINWWMMERGRDPIEMNEAESIGRQVEIY